ncbi:MAG: outer membrane protein assembly factor BamC [Psychromonas sp.]|nr:outer membrane protein assembly factor BamC [Psychromonas sp.]
MIKFIQQHTTTAAIVAALSLAGCTRFDTRMQANGGFDYQNVQLVPVYKSGPFSNDEARAQFELPVLTKSQVNAGYLTENVDIRPPTQLIPVVDGVLLAADQHQDSKIWFNAVEQEGDLKTKVWQLLNDYLAEKGIATVSRDDAALQLETAEYTQSDIYGNFLSHNEVLKKASYRFAVEEPAGGHSVALTVELRSYSEANDGKDLKFTLTDKRKKNIELHFVNDLLAFAYHQKQLEELKKSDSQPLVIKLGFDDNHQTSWIVENSFADTWRKLPALLSLLHFEIIDSDRNRGYFSVRFSEPDNEYWPENNLIPFELKEAEYFIQLGEKDSKTTFISWMDSAKKPLPSQKVTDIYLSITEQVRNVLLKKDKQTKAL